MHKLNKYWLHLILGIGLVVLTLLMPWLTESYWFGMISKIREAITTGDTGILVMASASNSIIFALQNTLSFIGILSFVLVVDGHKPLKNYQFYMLLLSGFGFLNYGWSQVATMPWESVCNMIAGSIVIMLIRPTMSGRQTLFRSTVIALQTFFAFQWLNIMPNLSRYYFGITDISNSIKRTSIYLESINVLNFVGLAFYMPIFISAGITAIMFISFDRYMNMADENYRNEKELNAIRSKALENRIYQEIHTLAHDLKTPLVAIRGLSSLLSISQDKEKILAYSERIDGSVEKMSEMITSFLFGSSRKLLSVEELLTYVRAQIPIENEDLSVKIEAAEDLPLVYANKIRVVRGLINIIENAMVVKSNDDIKIINIKVYKEDEQVVFEVEDNGIGIAPEHMEKIWEVGYSTSNTSGLGLSFTKKVIEDNGGRIMIESEVDIGTKVKIALPIATEEWGDHNGEENTGH